MGNQLTKYSVADVSELLGVTPPTLQHWLARGDLGLENQKPGRGKAREFAAHEVVRMALANEIASFGARLDEAFALSRGVGQLVEKYAPGIEDQIASGFTHRLLVTKKDAWDQLKVKPRGTSPHDGLPADEGYLGLVAVWAVEGSNEKHPRHALQALEYQGVPVIVINLNVIITRTLNALRTLSAGRGEELVIGSPNELPQHVMELPEGLPDLIFHE